MIQGYGYERAATLQGRRRWQAERLAPGAQVGSCTYAIAMPVGLPAAANTVSVKPAPAVRTMLWTDETLVAGLKRGEADARQHAVELYAPKLYRYASYQLRDPQAAEDLVSEVITRMLEKIDGYRYVGVPFQVWLFQIARNLVADVFRAKSKATVSLDEWIDNGDGTEPAESDARLENVSDRELLRDVLSQLTEEQRQIIILRVIEGWQPSEIAQLLGRSIDSVKSLQYRGIQSMRRYLERESGSVTLGGN